MNNEIKNKKVEVPKGVTFNDKDYLNSLLSCLKEMEKNYTNVLTEASNENLYQQYKSMFENYTSLQREAYELLFKNGWYVIEKAEQQKVANKYQTLNQEFTDLNG